jgi:hypothetical protein
MKNFLLFILIFPFLFSCASKSNNPESWDYYFSQSQKDTLLTDIVAYLYIPPKKMRRMVKSERFDAQHRSFYVEQINRFELDKLYKANDSTWYFFILRPARSAVGDQRGVCGKFTLDENKKITRFEEIFNTPVYGKEEIREKGYILFHELVKKGNIDRFHYDRNYMEWPDGRSVYDQERYEWVYVKDFLD